MSDERQRPRGLNRLLVLATLLGAGPDPSVEVVRYCGQCDRRLSKDARRCPRCGRETNKKGGEGCSS